MQEFKHDLLGRISEMNSGTAQTILYDQAGRLTGRVEKATGTPLSNYIYDPNGNRIKGEEDGISFTATYDAQDRVITYNSNSYTYNINGQRQSKTNAGGTTNYTFDTLGNLTAVSTPSKTIQYIIDGYGRRVAKIENGFVTRYYLWQDQLKLAAELNGAGQLIKRYVYTNNEHSPDYMLYQGNYFVFIKDHRGSILNVLNARTGQVMQSLKYSDWGKVIQDSNPGYQPFGFAGGMYETDTGLVHFGAREYDPEVGKWISKDPILFEGGDTNLYGYVLNDPVNFIDPDGKFAIALIPALPAIGAAIEGIVVAGSAIVAGWGISEGINYYNQKRPFPQGPPDGSVTLPNGDKRIYDGNGNPVRDEDWGHDRGHGVPHVHDWIPKPGGGFSRGPGRPPKPGECK